MGRIEISGAVLYYLLWAVTAIALVPLLIFQVSPLGGPSNVALTILITSLLIAGGIGVWRRRTGRDPEHLGTDEDIAWDPIAYPEQAAKQRWMRAIRRLPGDDEDD